MPDPMKDLQQTASDATTSAENAVDRAEATVSHNPKWVLLGAVVLAVAIALAVVAFG